MYYGEVILAPPAEVCARSSEVKEGCMGTDLLESLVTGRIVAADGGFVAPGIDEFFPPAILFEGTPFALNRVMLIRLISAVALLIFAWIYHSRAKLVPGRWQSAFESLLDFSRVQIGQEILEDKAKKYQPLLATIFIGTLFMNLTGIIPGLQLAGTSVVGMPLIYAVVAYVTFIVAGIRERGGWPFFRDQLFPPGVPWPVYFLMTPIEILSTFIIRPVTLTIRLLANMISGHMILALCFLGTQFLYFAMGGIGGALAGTVTLLGGVIFVAFEAFIACLQAYIFAMLTAAYIQLSITAH